MFDAPPSFRAEDAVEDGFLGFPNQRHGDGERREAEEKQDGDFNITSIVAKPDQNIRIDPGGQAAHPRGQIKNLRDGD